MLKDNLKDFLKLFFPLKNKSLSYDIKYAQKADAHALKDQSNEELFWVAKNTTVKRRILDIGCNTGLPLSKLCDLWQTRIGIGIDINSTAISIAKDNFKDLTFLNYDGLKIPLEDESIDHIIIHHVIGHVENPHILLSEAMRILVKGGTISIITPNWWYKFWQFPINCLTSFSPDMTILRYYSNKMLLKELNSVGLKSIIVANIGPTPSLIRKDSCRLRVMSISEKK